MKQSIWHLIVTNNKNINLSDCDTVEQALAKCYRFVQQHKKSFNQINPHMYIRIEGIKATITLLEAM